MKIIDILNKIANGEEPPKKIVYEEKEYHYDERSNEYFDEDDSYGLINDHIRNTYGILDCLNDEVEILETTITYKQDKKIEHIELWDSFAEIYDINKKDFDILMKLFETNFKNIDNKINEIIDYLQNN